MEPIADCECCGKGLHEGDDFEFCPEGLVWICRPCLEAQEKRILEEFGWIGVWQGDASTENDPTEPPERRWRSRPESATTSD